MELQEWMDAEQVREVFERYSKNLMHMFRFYCMQGTRQKLHLSTNLDYKASHMTMQEFVQFCCLTKIIPVLCSPDDCKQIFRASLKW